MSIVIAILIFGIIVLIHEFGHFIVARWSKIDVLEFSIGMGPSIYTYHGKKTDYSIKLFPIGGSRITSSSISPIVMLNSWFFSSIK
mgnify:CR=1 FL=1